MDATIFDGESTKPCSVADAQAAANQPGISWIDVRLDGTTAPDLAAASGLLAAVGIDPDEVHQHLNAGVGADFSLTSADAHGIFWLDDNDGTPSQQGYFSWTQMRMVTVRAGGDAAVAQVRARIGDRAQVLKSSPSTLPGVVLQLLLATVQVGVTASMIEVGALDMEVIATTKPNENQVQQLSALRTQTANLCMRFPMYQVNVQAALIDPGTVAGLDAAGMAQLQQFQASVQATTGLIGNLIDAIKSTAQDIQAQVSAWQGARINVLTIVTMIFLPITFLTGYFGMNFTWLDNQLDSLWVWLLLGVAFPALLVVVSAVLLKSGGYTLPHLRRRKA